MFFVAVSVDDGDLVVVTLSVAVFVVDDVVVVDTPGVNGDSLAAGDFDVSCNLPGVGRAGSALEVLFRPPNFSASFLADAVELEILILVGGFLVSVLVLDVEDDSAAAAAATADDLDGAARAASVWVPCLDDVVDVVVGGVVVFESDAVFVVVVVVVVAVIVVRVVVVLPLAEAITSLPGTCAFVVEIFVSALDVALFPPRLGADVTFLVEALSSARAAVSAAEAAVATQSAEAAFFSREPVGPMRSLLLPVPESLLPPPPPPPLIPPPPPPPSPPASRPPPCSFFV